MNIKPVPRSDKARPQADPPQRRREFRQPNNLGCGLTVLLTLAAAIFVGSKVMEVFPPGIYGNNQFTLIGAIVARLAIAFVVVFTLVGGLLYFFFAKVMPRKDEE
jgi:hypothetical protein